MALKAVAAPLGSPVGGSGTPGTIPVWSSGTTLGNSPLTVSGSNVTGAGAIRATGTAATAPAFTGSDTDTGIYFPAANQMRFATAGSFVAAFDSTGNFGIGETSPSTYGKLAITVGTTTIALNADATRADVQSYNKPLAINRLGNNTLMNEGGGNVTIGSAGSGAKLEVTQILNTQGGVRIGLTAAPKNNYYNAELHFFRGIDDLDKVIIDSVNKYVNASVATWGLKLPDTPGNGDTQTLDCYKENAAWTPTPTGFGGTAPTVFASSCTRIGRLVICNIVLTATGGNTYSSTYSGTTINLPVAAADLCAATLAQGTNAVPNATVSGGNILLPTFALTTVATVVTALYYV
jgi:hypothetical protein